MLAILLIPAGLCYTFGRMIGDTRQGWAILAAMTLILAAFLLVGIPVESASTPTLTQAGLDTVASPFQAGGNMEGKETRCGIVNSGLWAAATTAASSGSVNAMHDSLTPLGGLAPMVLMRLGEVVFGGAGSGLYGMLIFALVAVFVSGLMVGRTPEYLGKKIEAYDMKMASLVILICPILVFGGTAIAVSCAPGRGAVFNPGPHGFSEILYALSSAGNNNGSAFGGLGVGVPLYHLLLGVAMFGARYWVIVPTLALAGSLAAKKKVPATEGTLPTHGPTFVLLLVGIVLIVGALTTFSIANDVAKYFAILPAAFAGVYPALGGLDVMKLTSPQSAIVSALVFNALIIMALIPMALEGVKYRPMSASSLLRRHLLPYGLGGLVVPFVGIKLIDMALHAAGFY